MPINRVVFFAVFIVLVGTIVYAYFAPEQRPEKAATLTPKEYIELVEQKKQARKVKPLTAPSTTQDHATTKE